MTRWGNTKCSDDRVVEWDGEFCIVQVESVFLRGYNVYRLTGRPLAKTGLAEAERQGENLLSLDGARELLRSLKEDLEE